MILSGTDFKYLDHGSSFEWHYESNKIEYKQPAIPAQNIATALTTLKSLNLLPSDKIITQVINTLKVEGRFECLSQSPLVYVDVAHNPASSAYLSERLAMLKEKRKISGKTYAVFSTLDDKNCLDIIKEISEQIDVWNIAELNVARAKNANELGSALVQTEQNYYAYDSVLDAYYAATEKACMDDIVVVFGSFHTVSDVLIHKHATNNK